MVTTGDRHQDARSSSTDGREQSRLEPTRFGDLFDPGCPTRELLDRLGGKWTSMVIKVLEDGTPGEIRFAELKRRVPGVSQKMLSQTLRSLERDSLVGRRVEPSTPPRVHYRLTGLGISLTVPLAALRTWAERHMAEIDDAGAKWDRAAGTDDEALPPVSAPLQA